MKTEVLKCTKCNTYTLKELCPKCKIKTITPKPARFSIKENFSKYRIKIKNDNKNKKL